MNASGSVRATTYDLATTPNEYVVGVALLMMTAGRFVGIAFFALAAVWEFAVATELMAALPPGTRLRSQWYWGAFWIWWGVAAAGVLLATARPLLAPLAGWVLQALAFVPGVVLFGTGMLVLVLLLGCTVARVLYLSAAVASVEEGAPQPSEGWMVVLGVFAYPIWAMILHARARHMLVAPPDDELPGQMPGH